MELKVWVEGVQRTVCGVTEKTTCQDVVYALAHATGKTGRFTLIESWRNNERLLAPQEHPLKVLNKWGEYSQEVQFILQRSSLDGAKNPPGPHNPLQQQQLFKPPGPLLSPQMSRSNLVQGPGPGAPMHPHYQQPGVRPPHHSAPGPPQPQGLLAKAVGSGEPPAVWKPPPPGYPPPPQSSLQQPQQGPSSSHQNLQNRGGRVGYPNNNNNTEAVNARLSPDSGRGSDKTGSDTSNSYSENNKDSTSLKNNNNNRASSSKQSNNPAVNGNQVVSNRGPSQHLAWGHGRLPPGMPLHASQSASGLPQSSYASGLPPQAYAGTSGLPHMPPDQSESPYGFSKQTSMPVLGKGGPGPLHPPAYKPPPNPNAATSSIASSSSPADQPPPYREPPPPPGGSSRHYRGGGPSSQSLASGQREGPQLVRPPHYSPPPTHKTHLSRHPSRSSLVAPSNTGSASSTLSRNQHHRGRGHQAHPPTDMTELLNLVTAQQSTLQAQQADIRQFEAEEAGFSNYGESSVDLPPSSTASASSEPSSVAPSSQQPPPPSAAGAPSGAGGASAAPPSAGPPPAVLSPGSQMDLVLSEVRRLEEVMARNDDELKFLNSERAQMDQQQAASMHQQQAEQEDTNIRSEIMQLKKRLAGTDVELQRTNTTLRRLGDEMRNMSLEKTRQREQELVAEADRLQNEIKLLQKSSEDSANISQQLSKDVKEVEGQIRQRKSEVEQLIKEMREANMESLAISPPEESKQFLEGPPKPNSSRKMMGSPRQLETAVPTSRNPHGVWV